MPSSALPTEEALISSLAGHPREEQARILAQQWDRPHRHGPHQSLGQRWVSPSGRTTFLFDAEAAGVLEEACEHGVHIRINRLTEKHLHQEGCMRRIPGTALWVRTLELSPTLRASYSFSIDSPAQRTRPMRGVHRVGGAIADPSNPHAAEAIAALADESALQWSLHEGPALTRPAEWERLRATPIFTRKLAIPTGAIPTGEEAADQERPAFLSLPEQPTDAAIPLLVVFDADRWANAPTLGAGLARASELGLLPPMACVGVASLSIPDRKLTYCHNPVFLHAMIRQCTRWAAKEAAARGMQLQEQLVIAGQSLGALGALDAARDPSLPVRAAIVQSPSMWFTPGVPCSPADLMKAQDDGQEWATQQWANTQPIAGRRIVVQAGTTEPQLQDKAAVLAATMRRSGWDASFEEYDGGHDLACWRVELTRALQQLPWS